MNSNRQHNKITSVNKKRYKAYFKAITSDLRAIAYHSIDSEFWAAKTACCEALLIFVNYPKDGSDFFCLNLPLYEAAFVVTLDYSLCEIVRDNIKFKIQFTI